MMEEQDNEEAPREIMDNPATASLVKFAQQERDQQQLEFKEPRPRNEKQMTVTDKTQSQS